MPSLATPYASNIAKLLSDENVSVRGHACIALGKFQESGLAYVNKVANLLGDPEVEVQKLAEQMVVKACIPPAVQAEAVTGKDGKKGEEAPKPGPGKSVEIAASLLSHKEPGAKLIALRSLSNAGAIRTNIEGVAQLVGDEKPEVCELSTKAVTAACQEDKAIAMKLLKHSVPGTRAIALEAVGKIGREASGQANIIASMMKDKDAKTRENATRALGAVLGHDGAKYVDDFDEALRTPGSDEDVGGLRRAGAAALGKIGQAGAERLGKAVTTHENAEIRRVAVDELGNTQDPKDQIARVHGPSAAQALKDSNAKVRGQAILALGKMGEAGKFLNPLCDLLVDPDQKVQKLAEETVNGACHDPTMSAGEQTKKTGEEAKKYNRYAELAATLLSHKVPGARMLALRAIIKEQAIGGSIEAVGKVVDDENTEVSQLAVASVTQACVEDNTIAVKLLTHKDAGARAIACEVVGKLGREAAATHVDIIAKMLKGDHPKLRANAATALSKMGEKGFPHTSSIASLVRQDPDMEARVAGIHALGEMGDAGTKHSKDVLALCAHKDDSVRLAASKVIKKWQSTGAMNMAAD